MQGSVVVIAECRDDRTNWRRSTTVPCTGWARAAIACATPTRRSYVEESELCPKRPCVPSSSPSPSRVVLV